MSVPFLDLTIQNQALENDLKAACERVIRSGQYILGPEVAAFEKQIAAAVDARHAVAVSSGTDAILLALMTLGIGAGDEVICPSFTFFATAGCIARVGAKPVFVDSCPVCFNLDPGDVARKVTTRTKAIIPVHLFGQAAEMDGVMALADRRRISVIEDGAQALGAAYRGRKLGGIGTFGIFSFFPSKNLGGFGDSGMLVTNDDALAEKARVLRTHGAKPKYFHKFVGANFRMDPLQAALLSVKLPHYDEYTRKRRANAAYYTEKLSGLPGVRLAKPEECICLNAPPRSPGLAEPPAKIILPVSHAHNGHIWNQYPLRIIGPGQRDSLKSFLSAKGIGSEIYYPLPMHRQECFAYLGYGADDLPRARALVDQCLSIPIFPELTGAQKEDVVAALREFLAS